MLTAIVSPLLPGSSPLQLSLFQLSLMLILGAKVEISKTLSLGEGKNDGIGMMTRIGGGQAARSYALRMCFDMQALLFAIASRFADFYSCW